MSITAGLRMFSGAMLVSLAGLSSAADGLHAPDPGAVWPTWQARLSVTLTDGRLSGVRSMRHAALLGDYYLAVPDADPTARWRGGFRATSGLVLGHLGATVLPGGQAVSLLTVGGGDVAPAREVDVWPYVGFGYTGLAPRGGWGFSADVGLALRQPGAAPELGRALLGLRGWEGTLRRVDLTPMVQLGVRYSF